MTIGVEGFIGERLTEAREARGILTMSGFADMLGLSRNAVHVYEMNKAKPRPEVLRQMAEKLFVKEAYFFIPISRSEPNPVFQRSRHALTKHHRTIAERWFDWTKYVIDVYLKDYIEMPPLCVPERRELGIPDEPRKLTDKAIERIAMQCREYWDLGAFPIENVTTVLENNGIFVTHGLTNSDKLDAFSNLSEFDGSFHIFLGTDKQSATRSRFDASHELGHLILHAHLSADFLNDKTHRLLESQANRFAGAFLMPEHSFKKDVWMTSIEAFKVLKKDWKASVGAIIKRCDDLGLFGEDEARVRSLWIKYRKEWQEIEEDNLELEQPQLMKDSMDALLESGIVTRQQVRHELPFTQTDIERMLNLPEGYLSDDFEKEREFPRIRVREREMRGNAEVIYLDTPRKRG
jgi:Zn-dependent peptidase ImmA (M78 family)/transcriptional regulator with XRE-family HTH domain